MSDLIERLKRLEGVLLDQCNGNEGHPSYYSAEVVHRAAEQIESLQRENEELNGRLLDLQLDYVEALTNAITPEMRERIKAYKDWLDSPNTGELSPEHIYNILSDLLGEQG